MNVDTVAGYDAEGAADAEDNSDDCVECDGDDASDGAGDGDGDCNCDWHGDGRDDNDDHRSDRW